MVITCPTNKSESVKYLPQKSLVTLDYIISTYLQNCGEPSEIPLSGGPNLPPAKLPVSGFFKSLFSENLPPMWPLLRTGT